jgi:acyl phosphate:glycerol-3-phosphate acyltransferase
VLAVWVLVAVVFRYSSLAALVAAISAPLGYLLGYQAGPFALAILVMSLLLVWRHRANIGKLLSGKESKLGQKSAAAANPVPAKKPKGGGKKP